MAENEYIRRVDIEKAITAIRDLYREAKNFNAVSAVDSVSGEIRECVKNVDVAPVVHGHWIKKIPYGRECSNCGALLFYEFMPSWKAVNYCHSCGAKMDGKDG